MTGTATAGVYMLIFTATGARYIGATANTRKRRRSHLNDLRAGRHSCRQLQATFDLHGEGSLQWQLLQAVEAEPDQIESVLAAAEREWLERGFRLHPHLILNSGVVPYRGKGDDYVPGLAAKLRAAREAAGLSQQQAGQKSAPPLPLPPAAAEFDAPPRIPRKPSAGVDKSGRRR